MTRLGLLGVILLAACATTAPRLLPMTLASDEGWSGRITDIGLTVEGASRPVSVARAEHLSHGGGALLLNSRTDQGEYISLWVQLDRCEAGGRVYPYSLSACVADLVDPKECRVRLKGCAVPVDPRFRSQHAGSTGR
ncbi:hypothetical protein QO010_003567 [Caulobacter ginsengisoli]|uniref:Lipoprotein n=1 Tax=Caulobacter ginsengisoli TaxID=400775 RepID=A0ABU0IUT0_9CAUL|nr:hypothetical protein [Caulobacter ginsengisoli]MDQ0465775.1 hypothetical protein [Caulobacter ginsengisoli]